MSWHTEPIFIALRNVARGLGLNPTIARLFGPNKYEHAFDDALFCAIKAGDVVWDVGANVGYYTKRFIQCVGHDGHVVGFEPFPTTAERLCTNMLGAQSFT